MMHKAVLKLKQPRFDGIGAQIHRIISAYAIANRLGIPYQYDHISDYDNQIFSANKDASSNWNNFLTTLIPNFSDESIESREVLVHRNQRLMPVLLKIIASQCKGRRTLHILDSPHTITNRFPSFLEALDFSEKIPIKQKTFNNRESFQIVLHIRRGELGLSQFKSRYLPLSYYEEILSRLIPTFEKLGIAHQVIIPIEPGQDNYLHSDDPKVIESLRIDPWNPNLVRVSKNHFRLFYDVPNSSDTPYLMKAKWVENEDAWQDFILFLNSDIFIMSKSSLSYIAAMINKHRHVVYPNFWHPKLSSWLSASDLKEMNDRIFAQFYK